MVDPMSAAAVIRDLAPQMSRLMQRVVPEELREEANRTLKEKVAALLARALFRQGPPRCPKSAQG